MLTHIYGRIEKRIVDAGSKSEHEAIVIRTREGQIYKLRLRDGTAFDYTPFEKYNGMVANIRGNVAAPGLLVLDSVREIMPAGGLAPDDKPFPN